MIPDRFRDLDEGDYYDARAEAREDARREAAADRFDAAAETCVDCGNRWDPRYHRATRTDPAYVEVDECPECGSGPVSQLSPAERSARIDSLVAEYEVAQEEGDDRRMAEIDAKMERLQ